jgi:hypothetical protein
MADTYYTQNFPNLARVFQAREIELLHSEGCAKEIKTIIDENDEYLKRMKDSSFVILKFF